MCKSKSNDNNHQEFVGISTQKLDNIVGINIPIDLSFDKKISGRNGNPVASKKSEKDSSRKKGITGGREKNKYDGNNNGKGRKEMRGGGGANSFRIDQNRYKVFEIYVPNSRIPGVHYIVESQFPVTVYILRRSDLGNFENSRMFSYIAGNTNRSYHNEDVNLPHSGIWYLVIWNAGNRPTDVDYQLYV